MVAKNRYWTLFIAMVTASLLEAKMIDLSHDQGAETLMAPGNPYYNFTKIFEGDIVPGVYLIYGSYNIGEHGGTHMDAPVHFNRGGKSFDKVPLEDTVADGIMIDCSEEAGKNSGYVLSLEKVKKWEEDNGEMPNGAAVIINFNWSPRFTNSSLYFNTDNITDKSTFNFPYVSKEAIDWLVDEREIKILALDTASPDPFVGPYPAHVKLSQNNRLIIENLNNPGRLPVRDFRFYAAPVKFVGATGVQVRAFAVTHDKGNHGTRATGTSGWLIIALAFFLLAKLL